MVLCNVEYVHVTNTKVPIPEGETKLFNHNFT